MAQDAERMREIDQAGSASKTLTPFLERNMLDDGFRVFQDVSTLEDVFRFHKQNNRAIYVEP